MKASDKDAAGDWNKEGYEIRLAHHTMNRKYPIRTITYQAHDSSGNPVGHFHFTHDSKTDTLTPTIITVFDESARRKGLASAAYARAEADTGKIISKGKVQSPEAKALWSQPNRPFGKG